jgi:hypothetical protein
MIAATIPTPRWTPNRGSSQPPMKAPTIPTKEVADKSETGPAHDFTGQPAGNQANEQNHKETFARHVHALRGVEFVKNYSEFFVIVD